MPSNPSFNWSKLQNVYYNIRTCYDSLNWTIDNLYYNYIVALSPNATLVAIASKFVPHPNLIEVYSASGAKIWSIVFNSSLEEYIHSFHFRGEDLVVILNNGVYRYYNDFMGNFNEYSYLKHLTPMDNVGSYKNGERSKPTLITNLENNETEEIHKILEVQVWNSYLVIRMDVKFIICDLNTFTNFEIPLELPDITTFKFQPVDKEEALIIHAPCKQTIMTLKIDIGLTTYEVIDQELTDGPFTDISISSNGQLIALFNRIMKKIFVINNKFDQVLMEYDTINESSIPYQIEWCGNDAIVLSFKDEVKLIGPGQQSISFFYDIEDESEFDLDMLLKDTAKEELSFTIPILQSSIDGLRIITTNKVQFLSRVSETSVQMYQVGSAHPSSILVDCIDKFASNASKADANISILRNDGTLLEAMTECLKVALDEFDHVWQKRALRAVSFGKIYYDDYYDSDEYLSVLNSIQVLNQIRSPEIGLFLTYDQIKNLGWKLIVQMLLKRNQHYLTLKVIERLKLDNLKELVYIHWCCYKIKKDLDTSDVELFKIITEKLVSLSSKRINYISVEQISEVAHEEGRNTLCKFLVSLEPSVSKKIQQLLQFEEVESALIKSFQCGDYDLSKLILLYLQDSLSISQFFRVLNQNESVIQDDGEKELQDLNVKISSNTMNVTGELIGHMWIEAIGKYSPSLLERYYKQEGKNNELNSLKLKSLESRTPDNSEEYYETVKSTLHKSMNRSLNKRSMKALQKELSILELQKKLGETYMTNFYSEKSITAILTRLIKMNQLKPASKIMHDFSVSQEKYWYLALKTYSESKEFDRLYEFAFGSLDATTAKSPIGFEPFVETGFKCGAPKAHISAYIRNSQKYKYADKAQHFARNEDYESAGLEAFRMKDVELLRNILASIPSSNQQGIKVIKEYIENLGY